MENCFRFRFDLDFALVFGFILILDFCFPHFISLVLASFFSLFFQGEVLSVLVKAAVLYILPLLLYALFYSATADVPLFVEYYWCM